MKKILYLVIMLCCSSIYAQKTIDIVKIVDKLRYQWDASAINLKTYQGIQEFCLDAGYQNEITELLDEIHHWDTTLYFIVKDKFDETKDAEAEETLKDIELLETEYSTINFKQFISDECDQLKVIQESFDKEIVKKYEKEIKRFEKELVKYVNSITYRIDIIDEHIHHLKLD